VFKEEFHTLGSKSLIAFQVLYRVIEMTGNRIKKKLYRYLIIQSFYSITEFLECRIDKDIKYKTIFSSKCSYINYVL